MTKAMRRIGLAMLVAALVAGTPRRAAATIPVLDETFDLSGTFAGGEGTLGGSLVINVAAGVVQSSSATVTEPDSTVLTFSDVVSYGPVSGSNNYEIQLQTPSVSVDPSLVLYLPNTTTLAGYTGGPLGSNSYNVDGYISYYSDPFNLQSGSITPAFATPEPSTVPIVALAAAAGLVGLARRRRAGERK